jgi:hypothetical protein
MNYSISKKLNFSETVFKEWLIMRSEELWNEDLEDMEWYNISSRDMMDDLIMYAFTYSAELNM